MKFGIPGGFQKMILQHRRIIIQGLLRNGFFDKEALNDCKQKVEHVTNPNIIMLETFRFSESELLGIPVYEIIVKKDRQTPKQSDPNSPGSLTRAS